MASTTLHPLGLEVSHAHGPWIELKDGSALFDAISGIGVSNFGHGHPDIQRALKAQMDKHLHTMVYGEFLQDIQVQASRALCTTLPSSIDAVYFLNSGAEAIDAALKLAKRVTGRSKLFAVSGGYHGNTHGSLSVSSNEARKAPFRPLLPEVEFLNWNDITDLDRLTGLLQGIDAVVHLAAYPGAGPGYELGDTLTETLLQLNIVGAYNAFEAAKRAGCSRLVFASSIGAVDGYRDSGQLRTGWEAPVFPTTACETCHPAAHRTRA